MRKTGTTRPGIQPETRAAAGSGTEPTQMPQDGTEQETRFPAPGRFWSVQVIALTAMSFALGMNEFLMMGILPDIARGLSVPQTMVGNLVSLFAGVYAVCTPLGAAVSSRFRRFDIYLAMGCVFLLGNTLSGLATGYPLLALSRMVVALVAGPMVAVAMTFAPQVARPQDRTRFTAWIFSGFSIASVVGVPFGTWVADTFGWRWAFLLVSLITVVLLVTLFATLPRRSSTARVGFLSQFLLFTDPRILLGVGCVFCGAAATYVFYTYISPVLTRFGGIPARSVSAALVVYGLAALFSNLYSGRLARRGTVEQPLGRMWPFYLLHAALLVLLSVGCLLGQVWLVLLSVVGVGACMYLQNSPSQVDYVDSAMQYHPGSLNLSNSLNSMSFNLGITAGAAVGGLVRDNLGLAWLGAVGALFALAAALCSLRLLVVGRAIRVRRNEV